MTFHLRTFLIFAVPLAMILPGTPARAQRGALIEDLFRTIAEAQLEREQRKRLEAEESARNPPVSPQGDLQKVPVPRGQVPPSDVRASRPPSISVRSREAAQFAQNLVNFNGAIDPLVSELRANAGRNAAVRGLLPQAYQVAADTRTLIQRCDGLSALDPIVAPYSDLDAKWRQLSFQLRSLDGLSNQCTSGVQACDQLVSTMSRQLKLQPQFNRHELHDLMIVAATHMQALMDDLQLLSIPRNDIERLTHDCRLLRQRLLGAADHVSETSYEDVVTQFTDFVSRWESFSEQCYAINNPHLHRRLDRVRECGDQSYALLWMPPPYNAATLTASAKRLEAGCGDILDQLTIRSMVSLSSKERARVLESSHQLYHLSGELAQATTRRTSRNALRDQFGRFDQEWNSLRPVFYRLRSVNRATLASIDHECEQMRGALGITSLAPQPAAHEDLIEVAAALEGASEYLDADLQRYARYLQPTSYRNSLIGASGEFHRHAKQLHADLSKHSDLSKLQREAEHMLDGWNQLSKDLSHIDGHGLTERRAASLMRAQQELVPMVAKIAAALVER